MAQSYLNQIKQKIESKDDLFIDTKKGENLINNQIIINENRLKVIQAHHIEHWLIQVENILLTKLLHIEKSNRNKRFSQFNKFLELMRICINPKRLSSAIENNFNGFDLNNKEKEILNTLNHFKASNIWNSNIAYLIQNRMGIDQSAAITEFLSKAGAVPFIIGRNSFHILEHHSKNMSRIQQTDTNQFCNDHSPNHFRLNRYKSKNINSTIHKGNFHTFIAAFGYAPACPVSKPKEVSNLRSCPGRSLPFREISSALNVAALTGVAFRFQSEDGEFQDYNSSKKVDYNDHTLALSPKGRLITIEME